ncbi:MAG: sulfatase-like hydrolase/transferase [Myxococcota bacterium]|nr:sulfatase-like hydrolase/transferase [Myxococcota bacterium]
MSVPNVLLITAEDLSPRIGAFGDAVAHTPNLDQLASQGTRYTNTFTAAGVCAPSRAAQILSMYAFATNTQHMRSSGAGYAGVPPSHVKAYPELLRAAGHHTYNAGKTDYQMDDNPITGGPFTIWDHNGANESDWPVDLEEGRAWFGMVNHAVTHESGVFAPLGSWPHSATHFVMQVIRAFGMRNDPPPPVTTDPATVVLPPYFADAPAMRADLAQHYDNIALMDAQVGTLLAELEASGQADSTIVIWTTDHGDGLPRAKRELYDSGLKVPMIVRYPDAFRPEGATPGSVDDRLVSFVDLGPQILEWMGVPIPEHVHGQPFARLDAPKREYIYAHRDRIDQVPDRQRAVRDARFKYIRSWHPETPGGHVLAFRDNQKGVRELRELYHAGKLNPEQRLWFEPVARERLYDTQVDPYELRNLASDPAHAATLERLRAALDALLETTPDSSAMDEAELAESMWPGGEQPKTAAPSFTLTGERVAITSPTEGASIGYRTNGEPGWRLYTGAFEAESGSALEAKAVRYGWEESASVAYDVRR